MDANLLDIFGRVLQAIGWAFLPVLLLPLLSLVLPWSKWLEGGQTALISIIDTLNAAIGELVKYLLVLLVVSVAFSVFAVKIFGQSWTKLDEAAIYFHATVILLGSAATLLAGEHVRVDIFYAKLAAKSKALVDLVGFYALLLPFCLIIIWNAQSFIGLAWTSLEGSAESSGIRGLFILKTFVSVFAIMMLAQGMAIACRAALLLTGKPLPPRSKHIPPQFSAHERESGL